MSRRRSSSSRLGRRTAPPSDGFRDTSPGSSRCWCGSARRPARSSEAVATPTDGGRDRRRWSTAGVGPAVIDVTGATTIEMLAGLLGVADACVSNDSGAMHLAAAVGTPVVALFGPTNEYETAPLTRHGRRAAVLTHPVWCRPCMLRECPIDHRCMKRISPERVFDALITSDGVRPGALRLNPLSRLIQGVRPRSDPMTRPAVFLDRDGTLIEERGYLDRLDLLELFPWTIEAIRLLNRAGFATVVITNQSAIGRGVIDESFLASCARGRSTSV